MANISVTVTDGNNIAVSVTPLPTQVITIDRGIAGPVGPVGPAGSVTSVALSAPALFSVTGSPITTSGTLALTYSGTALPAANGGTGQILYAVGDLLYASTTTALSKLADVATGNALISGGVSTAPAWGKVGLTTHVSGTLPVANGGTGKTTIPALSVPVANTLDTFTSVTPAASQSIRINSGGTAWEAYTPSTGSGSVTSVSVVSANGLAGTVATATTTPAITLSTSVTGMLKGNGTAISAGTAGTDYVAPGTATTFTATQNFAASGMTLKGSSTGITTFVSANASVTNYTITFPASTGTVLTTAAVVQATEGGTGQTSYAVGDLLYASTTTALSKLADIATGNSLISGGVGVAPSWGKIGLTTHVSGTLPVANGGTALTTIAARSIPVANALDTYTTVTPAAGQSIRINAGNTAWEAYTPTTGSGTVTSVSVVSANGLAGTVATATTTPAITLSTSVTGVLKGNGTSISAATAGTDYVTPTGTETLTNKTLTNPTFTGYTETVNATYTTALNPANGTIQRFALTGNTTFTDSLASGQSITLMIDDGTAFTVTWPTMNWVGGSAPTLSTTGYTVIELWKVSTTLYGALVGTVA